ncbi:FmdB family zinc ribbon protein [Agromyces sp. GXS1127]|uniref:FmdB family zinc ribbon protein n=1 Tax=Agromyces sp. GXS1127 TaxID=3424181 RepID=UPI003D31A761
MPTYSYRCTECGEAFDIQQAFTDPSLTECPACSGRLRKLYGSVGVTFNGSGFYRTDSRAAAKGGASAESGSGSGGSSGDSSSSSSGSSSSSSSGASTSSSTTAA